MTTVTKSHLRLDLRRARTAYVATRESAADAEALRRHAQDLIACLGLAPGARILSFEPWPSEPPVGPLSRHLSHAGYDVLLPITLPDFRLDWRRLNDPVGAPLGIDAPASAALALIPAAAVDREGNRLGHGKGCYDRVIPTLPPGTRALAVVHPVEILDTVPHNRHDRPVDGVLTTDGITWFAGRGP